MRDSPPILSTKSNVAGLQMMSRNKNWNTQHGDALFRAKRSETNLF
jgi:hypothetical protein